MKSFLGFILLLIVSLNQVTAGDTMSESIEQVKNRHQSQLMALPGVVSVGIGLDENKQSIIIIGIETDNEALMTKLPQQLDGYQVQIKVIGTIRIQ